jgi:hypothetical protein
MATKRQLQNRKKCLKLCGPNKCDIYLNEKGKPICPKGLVK